jgi:TonB family protein
MLQRNPRTKRARSQAGLAKQQALRLLVALSLLLLALAVVLVRNREFWFGPEEAVESDAVRSESVQKTVSAAVPAPTSQAPAAPAVTAKNHVAPKTSTVPAVTQPSPKDAANPASASPASANPASANSDSPVVATNRAALPPLDVEVVAGDTHRTVHPGSNVTKVEIHNDSNRVPVTTLATSLPTNAAASERLSPKSASEAVPELRQAIDSTYPLLGQHARVQGSVVLQAVIGADGTIEDLRVLSGPAILSTAAEQAVRQWRFKPYLQNGQPVETKAKITVNFSIRVSDNSAKTS